MALINETTLQRRLAALERFMISVGGVAGGTIESVRGIPTAPGDEGDVAFDSLTNQMYVYLGGVWTATGNHTWIKYADEVKNIGSNGKVLDSSDVVGGMYDSIQVGTKYIGQVLNQASNVESSSVLDYTWTSLHVVTPDMVDLDSKPGLVSNITIDEELYQTNNAAGIKSRVHLTWDTSISSDVEPTASTIVQMKPTLLYSCSDSTYSIKSDCENNDETWTGVGTNNDDYETVIETPNNYAIIQDVPVGDIDFRFYASTSLGVKSDAVIVEDEPIGGLTATPQSPTNLTLSSSEGQTLLTWDRSTELDVKSGGAVQIRIHPLLGASAQWSSAQILVESLQGTTTSKTVPLMTGTYMVKFIDSGDNESVDAATVENSFAPTNFNFVSELDENADGFLGTKTNCSVVDTDLKLDADETTMTYQFPNTIDLGQSKNVRVVPDFNALIYADGEEICHVEWDSNNPTTTGICGLTQFCSVQLDAIIKFEVQTSDDGTTFGDWKRLIAGNYSCRAFKFRVLATVGDTNTLITFTELKMLLDTVDLIQTGSVLTSTTADTVETFGAAFYTGISGTTLPRIGTQTIGGSAGDSVVISDRTATTFEISVYNNGSRVQRYVDWQAIGQ